MEFHEKYKNYSNTELLKILKKKEDYQLPAIEAAEEILKQRTITLEENIEVENYFLNMENKKNDSILKLNKYSDSLNDLLQPLINPTEKTETRNWLNILLLIIFIQYLFTLYETIPFFYHADYTNLDFSFIIFGLSIVYVPVIFYLLFKRKKWGWILIFADCIITIAFKIQEIFFFYKFNGWLSGNIISILFPLIIKTLFALFLWRQETADFFNVSVEIKKKTVYVSLVILAVLTLISIITLTL
jgi:hypothetical protein